MPAPADFQETAELLNDRGIVSTIEDGRVTAEVVLSGSATSRMRDPKAETALLGVKTHVPHPLAGVGYLATIALPIDPHRSVLPAWSAILNEQELASTDFVPRLGAWGVRGAGNELVYSQFIPMDLPMRGLQSTIMWWMIKRTIWLRDTFWAPNRGLTVDRDLQETAQQ